MLYDNRTYLDFNATAPVLPEVLDALHSNQWPMGNPSSVHTCGKKAKRLIGEVRNFLYDLFSIKERDYDLFFHSGATEGINTIVKSLALQSLAEQRSFHFLFGKCDHSCVVNQVGFLNTLKLPHQEISVNNKGEMNLDEIKASLKNIDFSKSRVLLNWTWVNNETGVVNPLERIASLKKLYPELIVHVDAVQAIGKIEEGFSLNSDLDAYTFSGHKFGALKGIGFTFMAQGKLNALMNGGGQQGQLRSGTENTWGIYSLLPAIKAVKSKYQFSQQNEAKKYIENHLLELIGDKGSISGFHAPHRNGNTIYFILNDVKAQSVAMALDMGGLDVSNGSACSSGAVVPSRVLLAMGYSEDQAVSAIRLSFGAFFTKEKAIELWPKLEKVLSRFVR